MMKLSALDQRRIARIPLPPHVGKRGFGLVFLHIERCDNYIRVLAGFLNAVFADVVPAVSMNAAEKIIPLPFRLHPRLF